MSFSIFFFPKKSKKDKNGNIPIYCKISTSGKDRAEYFTKIKVDEKLWLATPKRASNGSIDYIKGSAEKIKNYNKTLNLIEAKVQKKYNDLIEEDAIITASDLKDALTGASKPTQYTILYFLEKTLDGRKTKRSKTGLRTHINNFKLFLKEEFKVQDIPVKALPQKKYLGLGAKLVEWGEKRGWAKIYAKVCLNAIKSAVNLAVDQHYLEYNPIRYKLKLKNSDINKREILSFSEVKRLEEFSFSRKGFERTKDVFLFQLYTGLSYIDVLKLRKEHIVKGIDGRNWIVKDREKTKNTARIPLIDKAQAIIDKYKHLQQIEGKLLPVVHNCAYNRSLQKMMPMVKIEKHITSHCARHTFATLMRESGSDLSNIKQIVAHSKTSMTEHYAKLTPGTLSEEISKLEKKLGS